MTTLLKEVYNLYKIYTKLNSALTNSTIVNESFCREIKTMILNDGCIAIKFAQWIISRLRSEPGKHIEYIVNYFDDIFDNSYDNEPDQFKRIEMVLSEIIRMKTKTVDELYELTQLLKDRLIRNKDRYYSDEFKSITKGYFTNITNWIISDV